MIAWYWITLVLFQNFVFCNELWDLVSDPNESTNLVNEIIFEDIRNELQDRLEFWRDLVIDNDGLIQLNHSQEKEDAYKSCGGVCPYLDDTYDLPIDQKYFPKIPSIF